MFSGFLCAFRLSQLTCIACDTYVCPAGAPLSPPQFPNAQGPNPPSPITPFLPEPCCGPWVPAQPWGSRGLTQALVCWGLLPPHASHTSALGRGPCCRSFLWTPAPWQASQDALHAGLPCWLTARHGQTSLPLNPPVLWPQTPAPQGWGGICLTGQLGKQPLLHPRQGGSGEVWPSSWWGRGHKAHRSGSALHC